MFRKDRFSKRINDASAGKILGIKRKTIRAIIQAARETHPDEFSALMRYNRKTGMINEFLMLPGTISGRSSAQMQLHMMPIDFNVAGSVHSHPTNSFLPSEEDLRFFEHFGALHIIICWPYSERTWACYRYDGEPYELNVVD